MKAKSKKKTLPKLAANLKEVSAKLQKQADEIVKPSTITVAPYMPQATSAPTGYFRDKKRLFNNVGLLGSDTLATGFMSLGYYMHTIVEHLAK